jgi:hypothetical protein
MDEHVATIWFIDGVWRPVYEGDDDPDGNLIRVY